MRGGSRRKESREKFNSRGSKGGAGPFSRGKENRGKESKGKENRGKESKGIKKSIDLFLKTKKNKRKFNSKGGGGEPPPNYNHTVSLLPSGGGHIEAMKGGGVGDEEAKKIAEEIKNNNTYEIKQVESNVKPAGDSPAKPPEDSPAKPPEDSPAKPAGDSPVAQSVIISWGDYHFIYYGYSLDEIREIADIQAKTKNILRSTNDTNTIALENPKDENDKLIFINLCDKLQVCSFDNLSNDNTFSNNGSDDGSNDGANRGLNNVFNSNTHIAQKIQEAKLNIAHGKNKQPIPKETQNIMNELLQKARGQLADEANRGEPGEVGRGETGEVGRGTLGMTLNNIPVSSFDSTISGLPPPNSYGTLLPQHILNNY
jgi:hypothetical protein